MRNNKMQTITRGTTELSAGTINFTVSVKIDVGQMSSWEPARVVALMEGIAKVVAAAQRPAVEDTE